MVSTAGSPDGLRIGELASRTGASTRSLRHYEQRGLITAHRDQNGYRRYDPDVVQMVRNLRRLLGAGLSIDDIYQFGSCVRALDDNEPPCDSALAVYQRRLGILDAKITTLNHLRANLAEHTNRLQQALQPRHRTDRADQLVPPRDATGRLAAARPSER